MNSLLHPYEIPDFADGVTAWYEGLCPMTKVLGRLPRTAHAEWVAKQMMTELAQASIFSLEGKMYGVLLVATTTGERFYLKAFSGLLRGQKTVAGWVPMIDGGDRLLLEEQEILAQLRDIRQRIAQLQELPERQTYQQLTDAWQDKITQFNGQRRQNKQQREQQRSKLTQTLHGEALQIALQELQEISRQESNHKRDLKRQRDHELRQLSELIHQSDTELQTLYQRRKTLSRNLQKKMHRVYQLKNFAGDAQAIADILPQGLPTGTGDCCAPKLLHYAAQHNLKPLALAEFWWGKNTERYDIGHFYPACAERCQPILGFLLSGLENKSFNTLLETPEIPLEIIYEDADLVVINKPSGLLTIPGRSSHNYDSVFSRLKRDYPQIYLIHRLDQDTSGLVLFAKSDATQKQLQQQFKRHQISKTYTAILEQPLQQTEGLIKLPLWSDPRDRPRQKVDFEKGKSSQTKFKKIDQYRIELQPITGRTHQLRVHCAHFKGLNNPIRGDRLYGRQETDNHQRLHLHATAITLTHPTTKEPLTLRKKPSF